MTVGRDITFKVKIRDHHIKKDGTCAIYIQVFAKGEQIRIGTGLSCSPKYWSKTKQRLKGNAPNAHDHNLIIDDMVQRIHEMRVKSRLGHLKLSPDVIREFVTESSLSIDFIAYMDWKIKSRKTEIAYDTFRHHRSTLKSITDFKSPLPFSQINNDLIHRWRKKMEGRGLAVNTIANKVKIIKYYLNRAQDDGIIFDFPKRALKITEVRGARTALTRNQLQAMLHLYHNGVLPDGLRQTLRCFLFSCFTGLRYGDIVAFNQENILGDYLVVVPRKTRATSGGHITIPINQIAESFLNRYSKYPLGPVISNQKMNINLKKIAKTLGIQQHLSYHVSRHTFATIYLELGGSVHTLQNLLGHSKIELTMVYVTTTNQSKSHEISNFDKLLAKAT